MQMRRSILRPQKVLILNKITRYEHEKSLLQLSNDALLQSSLASRGSQLYESLKKHHNVHTNYVQSLVKDLQNTFNIPHVKLTNRLNYSNELVAWADMIITAGGDGTFLMGASKVRKDDKPVIGFNTDPSKSEGYLLFPRDLRPVEALKFVFGSRDPWGFRKRLRITLEGPEEEIRREPMEIHQQKVIYPEYRFIEESKEDGRGRSAENKPPMHSSHILPVLALNEAFIGESLSSRVSCLQISIDQHQPLISKNSGFCISTGSGSTSWTFNINKLTPQAVKSILEITSSKLQNKCLYDDSLVSSVTSAFNNELLFNPNESVMGYTIRDPISVGTFPSKNEMSPRGFARDKIKVRSMCFDACLVIDGSLSFKFNDGMSAIVEMKDEDDLRTVFWT